MPTLLHSVLATMWKEKARAVARPLAAADRQLVRVLWRCANFRRSRTTSRTLCSTAELLQVWLMMGCSLFWSGCQDVGEKWLMVVVFL
uniref:Uncharacterized protein n=1 Tax=Setaria italica TaxID=4555 RepID=K4AHA6_SETIT